MAVAPEAGRTGSGSASRVIPRRTMPAPNSVADREGAAGQPPAVVAGLYVGAGVVRSAASGCERGDVGLPGQQEPPEAEPPVAERLVQAQEEQVLLDPALGEQVAHHLPPRREQLDRVLGVVVVPRDAVVVEEGEQLAPVLQEPAPVVLRRL